MGISAAVTDAIARAAAIGGLVALFIVAIIASLALGPALSRTSDDRARAAGGPAAPVRGFI